MILTDGKHLVSDRSHDELHTFARKMGLKPEWFQGRGHRIPHYDLTTQNALRRAQERGAVWVNSRELVRRAVR